MNEFISVNAIRKINNGYVTRILPLIICKYNISTLNEINDRVKFKITAANPIKYFCYIDEKFDDDFTYEIIYELQN